MVGGLDHGPALSCRSLLRNILHTTTLIAACVVCWGEEKKKTLQSCVTHAHDCVPKHITRTQQAESGLNGWCVECPQASQSQVLQRLTPRQQSSRE